jgi:REP element-mobilizing transposase RayT
MPRAERIWFPGAIYHIIQRGNDQNEIYKEDRDFIWFLKTVMKVKKDIAFKVYCYVLMSNHYHMTVETSDTHISDIMHAINSTYAIRFNQKYNRKGHVFQGRFKGLLVDKENYLMELSRYIHLNPVKAGLVEKPEHYQWSSYRFYVKDEKDWIVDPEPVLALFQGSLKDSKKNYANFVYQKLSQIREEKDWLKENTRRQRFLGSREFVKKMTGK